MPDLIVVDKGYLIKDPKRMNVLVKNNGSATSVKAILSARHIKTGNKAFATIPPIKPGYAANVEIEFTSALREGNRIKLIADIGDDVSESNENNNTKYVNY
jgi:hypothetical protein